jgi:hypothetical protein
MTESIADFKERIAIIRRRIETGKEYSIIGASRIPAWCCAARGKRVGSGQRTIKQNDSTVNVERRKPTKPTRKTKIQ